MSVTFLTGENCGACKQLKAQLSQYGLDDKVTMLDAYSAEGALFIAEHDLRSIPVLYNHRTDKMIVGSKTTKEKLEEFFS